MKRISNRILTFVNNNCFCCFNACVCCLVIAMTKGKKPESEQLKALRFEKHELVKPIDKKVNEDNVLKNQTKELEKKIEAMQNESGPKIKKIEEQIEATKKEISKLNSEATSLEKELECLLKKCLTYMKECVIL
nr:hypothetical protein [Mycoplasmopsis bovis]